MTDPGTASHPARRDFALCVSEGTKRFAFSIADEGVALDAAGLAWSIGGAARAKTYGEIAAIRLRRTPTTGDDVGLCNITFIDGTILNVMGATRTGFADPARAALYRDFINTLHQQLAPADGARIAFTSGIRGGGFAWMRPVGAIAMVAAVLLFVMTPLGLALAGDRRGYAMTFGGVILTSTLFWQWRRSSRINAANIPQPYRPDQVPATLLP